jgi:hydroxymethylglutaryl-CoA lyase
VADFVEIIEVSPRDGLQNETVLLTLKQKLDLIEMAASAGLKRMEVASFVNPARVPQMAHAEEMISGTRALAGIRGIGLVLNLRGYERAQNCGCEEINAVIVASETFSGKNQGVTIAQGIENWRRIAEAARANGVRSSLTIAAAFGCPFEGEVLPQTVASIVEQALASPPDELAFADTIGCGVPPQVRTLVADAGSIAGGIPLRMHFHDTRNTAIANVVKAVELGVRRIDASIGGTGGCPFAPAATGNVATEDVVYTLHRMGLQTGLDLDALIKAADWSANALGHSLPGSVGKAGPFPR